MRCWLSTSVEGRDCGMALLMVPGVNFGKRKEECETHGQSLGFFYKYLKPYRRQVVVLLLGMLLGSLLQLVFPFLTDNGIGKPATTKGIEV